ncbi:MAG TPA: hypothetical protein PKG48_05910 [Bacteroidales bacterium]|nr:hypothetical protein [Bacteroidales bacterium]
MIPLQSLSFCRLYRLFVVLALVAGCRQASGPETPGTPTDSRLIDSVNRYDSLAIALQVSNAAKALNYSNRALDFARQYGQTRYIIHALNTRGMILMTNRYDSSEYYLDRALKMADTSAWKTERAHIFYNMARGYLELNDFESAIILLDSSIHAGTRYNRPQPVCASLIALGMLYNNTGDTTRAVALYDSAMRLAGRNGLAHERGVALGNLAFYRKDARQTIRILKEAIGQLATGKGTEAEQAQFLMNIGFYQSHPDSALYYYRKSLDLSERCGLQKSAIAAYNNMAYAYLDRKDATRAGECLAGHAIPLAQAEKDYEWLAVVYDSYADVLIAGKSYSQAVEYLRKSKEARIMADQVMATRHIRVLNARFELKNKDLLIREREGQIALKNERIARMTAMLVVAGLLILSIVALLLWFRQRTTSRIQRLKLESAQRVIEAEEREKERTGMELHDSAGSLSLKVNEVFDRWSDTPAGLREAILGPITEFNREVRNMSHRLNKKMLERRAPGELLSELCRLATETGKLRLVSRIDPPESEVPVQVVTHLFRIVQELLNNAMKHAAGAEVLLKITFAGRTLRLEYHDYGPGFTPRGDVLKGMGISNIFARANLMNGTAVLNSEPGMGVAWEITARF